MVGQLSLDGPVIVGNNLLINSGINMVVDWVVMFLLNFEISE